MFNQMNMSHSIIFMLWFIPIIVMANTDLPDPTRPATYIDKSLEPVFFEEIEIKENIDWKLSAIRISAKDRTAIINGKLVRVGDDVGPAKVIEINPLSIVINHEEQKLIVRLYKNNVMKDYKIRQ